MTNSRPLPHKPRIQESLYCALHNARAGVKTVHNAHNFARIALEFGYAEDARFQIGPPSLHPHFYAPTEIAYDLTTHMRGLTSLIVNSPRFNSAVRAGELIAMVDGSTNTWVDEALEMTTHEEPPKLMRRSPARRAVRQEVRDSLERETQHGDTEFAHELAEVRTRLTLEWSKSRQMMQAGVVASAGLLVARRLRKA
jgi:hypothetical protein